MNIVTALQCEADPLIQAFDLSGTDPSAPFQLYRNDWLNLIISTPGKTSAAAAVSFLAARERPFDRNDVWLNVGVAGHPEREIGEMVCAGKIEDRETGECWYPQPVAPVDTELDRVYTVSKPVRDFDESAAHDMEAAGFYESALRFTTVERAHVLKMISDDGDSRLDDLDRSDVRDLIANRVEDVRSFLHSYRDLTDRDAYLEDIRRHINQITEQVHFTESQKHQLQKQLERWTSVYSDRNVGDVLDEIEPEAEAILSALSSEIDSADITFQSSS